jgi:transcriptional regulator with XRE-family HTH domain
MENNLIYNIKVLREVKGFTQEYVSYCQIENGRTRLTANQLLKISEIFEIKIQDIIDFKKSALYDSNQKLNYAEEETLVYHDSEQVMLLKELIEMQREVIASLKKQLSLSLDK